MAVDGLFRTEIGLELPVAQSCKRKNDTTQRKSGRPRGSRPLKTSLGGRFGSKGVLNTMRLSRFLRTAAVCASGTTTQSLARFAL